MGFFDWLTRPSRRTCDTPDVIWLTRQAKLAGVVSAVKTSLSAQGVSVFLLAQFENSLAELRDLARSETLEGPSLLVAKAEGLKPQIAATSLLEAAQQVEIVVVERHPLRSHDDAILDFACRLPCKARVVFHVSLEDPLMRLFAGDWVLNTLRKLGMKEDEAINSGLVARRVKAAQKKLAHSASSDLPAGSAEEWLERNCPQLWRKISDSA